MIVAFKHVEMGNTHQGKFYENVLDFARAVFKISVDDKGFIVMGDYTSSVNYKLGDDKRTEYTKLEALQDYIRGKDFRAICKSRYYTLYHLTPI